MSVRKMVNVRVEYNSLGYYVGGKMWEQCYLIMPNRIKPFLLYERRIQ